MTFCLNGEYDDKPWVFWGIKFSDKSKWVWAMGQKPVSLVFTPESYPSNMFRFTRSKSLTSEMNRSIFQKYRIFRPKGWDWFLRLVQHQFLGVISGISWRGSPMTSSPNFCMGPEIGWVHTPIIPNLWPFVCFFDNFLDKQPHDPSENRIRKDPKKSPWCGSFARPTAVFFLRHP